MKPTLISIFLLLLSNICFSQNQHLTIEEALSKSAIAKKPLLIFIDTKTTSLFSQMNTLEYINGEDFLKRMNENFVVYEGSSTNIFLKNTLKTYYINSPKIIFMHSNGEVFYIDCGCYQTKDGFENMLAKALVNASKKQEMSLKNQYSKSYSKEKLEKLISLRINAGMTDNSSLIELYQNYINKNDSLDYKTVKFILTAGPVIMSKAHKLIKDLPLVAEIYRKEPSSFGRMVNTNIIENTLQKGINTKCLPDAINAAMYYKTISRKDIVNGQKYYDLQLLTYYLKTTDTANYLLKATEYIDKHFMYAKSTDSIRYLEATRTKVKNSIIEKINNISKLYLDEKCIDITHSKTASYYSNELNGTARNFVETSTTNKLYMNKALSWSKRAIELKPSSQNFDTYALILYRLNFIEQAITVQKKAIEIAKELKNPFDEYVKQLENIKNKKL